MKVYIKNSTGTNCNIILNDMPAPNQFFVSCDEDKKLFECEVPSSEFDIEIKQIYDLGIDELNEIESNVFKDKVLKKLAKTVLNTFDKFIFRVDCRYHLSGICENEVIEIEALAYLFDTYDILDLLQLLPIDYCFTRLTPSNGSAQLVYAHGQNRSKFLSASYKLGLFTYGLLGLWKLPLQYSRVKHYTKDKVVTKKLKKFLALPVEEQNKKLDKQMKITDKY